METTNNQNVANATASQQSHDVMTAEQSVTSKEQDTSKKSSQQAAEQSTTIKELEDKLRDAVALSQYYANKADNLADELKVATYTIKVLTKYSANEEHMRDYYKAELERLQKLNKE